MTCQLIVHDCAALQQTTTCCNTMSMKGMHRRGACHHKATGAVQRLALLVIITQIPFSVSFLTPQLGQLGNWFSQSRVCCETLSSVRECRRSLPARSAQSILSLCMYDDVSGKVLLARPSAQRVLGEEFYEGLAILVVGNSPQGTRALVVNRPTPLLLKHLDLPRFHEFASCRLFHGGTMKADLGEFRSASLEQVAA
jgi:hypothetical protein